MTFRRLNLRFLCLPPATGHVRLAAAALCALVATPQAAQAVLPNGFPEKLAFYYGEPANVNGAGGNTTTASAVFDDYDLVVFGEGIEQSTHPAHSATATIIGNIASTTRAYGYLDLCVDNPNPGDYRCSNFSQSELEARVDAWKAMGAAGIFLDQAGCDYTVSRARLNAIVDYIHDEELSAFVNIWNQDDAFSPDETACNPDGLPTSLGLDDYTLLESWAVVQSDWSENYPFGGAELMPRGDKVLAYKNTYGTKVATVNTIAKGNPPFDQAQLDYTWWATLLFGFDAMAWGETWVYSSDTNSLPFRTRPNPNAGSIGSPVLPLAVTHNGDLHSRATTTNTIHLDTSDHSGRFAGKNVVTQSPLKPHDLVMGDVAFTPSDVTFTLRSNTAPITNFQVFIDSDNNPATGFLHSDEGITTVGADYMVDSEDVYTFTGSTQTTWSWSIGSSVSPVGLGTTRVSVTMPRNQVGHTSIAPLTVLMETSDPTWNTRDFLPRSPSTVWEVNPAFYQQAGTQSGDLIAGNARFSDYYQTSKLTFTMDSNGADIDGYRVMIDVDNNASTGISFWGIGAEYMIENGYLYEFIGATSSDWSWAPKGAVVEIGQPEHGIGSSHVQASIIPDVIGYTPGSQITVMHQHYNPNPPSYESIDMLPRPSTGTWQVSSNLARQDASPDTLTLGNATFSANNISFEINSNGGPIDSYRIFIDKDNNASTGYKHASVGITGVGAEYMIEDGELHEFCGSTQTTWCWTFESDAITDSGYGTSQITVELAKSEIAYSPGSTLAIIAENFTSSTESLDHLIRSDSTVWRVKP